MNIHLPAILMFTRGTRFWHTAKWDFRCVVSLKTRSPRIPGFIIPSTSFAIHGEFSAWAGHRYLRHGFFLLFVGSWIDQPDPTVVYCCVWLMILYVLIYTHQYTAWIWILYDWWLIYLNYTQPGTDLFLTEKHGGPIGPSPMLRQGRICSPRAAHLHAASRQIRTTVGWWFAASDVRRLR